MIKPEKWVGTFLALRLVLLQNLKAHASACNIVL